MDGKSRCNSIELDFKSSIKLLYLPWFEPKKTSTKQGLQNSNPPKNHFKKNGCSVKHPCSFPCKKKNGVHFCCFFIHYSIPQIFHRRGATGQQALALDSRVRGNSSLPPGWQTLKRIKLGRDGWRNQLGFFRQKIIDSKLPKNCREMSVTRRCCWLPLKIDGRRSFPFGVLHICRCERLVLGRVFPIGERWFSNQLILVSQKGTCFSSPKKRKCRWSKKKMQWDFQIDHLGLTPYSGCQWQIKV